MTFAPPLTSIDGIPSALQSAGHAVVDAAALLRATGQSRQTLDALRPAWDDLPPDAYLRDGGRYRRRRHSCFIATGMALEQVAHRAHWQSLDYNALHGGFERWFDPVRPEVVMQPGWQGVLKGLAKVFSSVRATPRWYVEAHQFRIDTTDGIGRPTPEGAHRDGVDFVAVILVGRVNVKGGETRVFDAAGPQGMRFTMTEPWTTLLLDDVRVMHESTPIQPLDTELPGGHRDTLVLTFRAAGFQGP